MDNWDDDEEVDKRMYIFENKLEEWSQSHKLPEDHGYWHWKRVSRVAAAAFIAKGLEFTKPKYDMIYAASWLYDVDDPKISKFVALWLAEQKLDITKSYPIARHFLLLFTKDQKITDGVIEMIGLVTYPTNGGKQDAKRDGKRDGKEDGKDGKEDGWKYVPRDAVCIMALGIEGVKRSYEVAIRMGNPLWTKDTPLATDNPSLAIALHGRSIEKYVKSGGKSASLIDHFYDKLLHLGQSASGNFLLKHMLDDAVHALKKWLFFYCSVAKTITIVGPVIPTPNAPFPSFGLLSG
jgi:uncharacterized protein